MSAVLPVAAAATSVVAAVVVSVAVAAVRRREHVLDAVAGEATDPQDETQAVDVLVAAAPARSSRGMHPHLVFLDPDGQP